MNCFWYRGEVRAHMYIILYIRQLPRLHGSIQITVDEVCQRFQAILAQAACANTATGCASAQRQKYQILLLGGLDTRLLISGLR